MFKGGKFEGPGKTVYNDGTYQEGKYEDGQLVALENELDKLPKNLNDSIEQSVLNNGDRSITI